MTNGASLKASVGLAFVVGARRTGTTMLYGLLCSSRDTHPFVGEFQFLTHVLDAFASGEKTYERLTRFFFEDHARFGDFEMRTVHALVKEAVDTLEPRRCAVFKNPELSFHVETLARLFPAARFVAMVRDPCDQAASERATIERQRLQQMHNNPPMSARELGKMFANYYRSILSLRAAAPERIVVLRYEDVVRSPKSMLTDACKFLGITFEGIDPERGAGFGHVDPKTMQARPSWSDLYGQPVSTERIGVYRDVFEPNEIADIKAETGEICAIFGY